nr:RecName: Full=ATP synthase epsilon chain, chloroplastic; AltName: Full=ATP synthase F1 sector epsilon subunit; AltName: Full=F-ATPase epsilon subunit [Populus euphratica]
QIIEANLALRR